MSVLAHFVSLGPFPLQCDHTRTAIKRLAYLYNVPSRSNNRTRRRWNAGEGREDGKRDVRQAMIPTSQSVKSVRRSQARTMIQRRRWIGIAAVRPAIEHHRQFKLTVAAMVVVVVGLGISGRVK